MYHELQRILSQLYSTTAAARHLAERAGVPLGFVDMDGPVAYAWTGILREARRRHRIVQLLETAIADYPQRMELQQLLGAARWSTGADDDEGYSREYGTVAGDDSRLDALYRMVYEIHTVVGVLRLGMTLLAAGFGIMALAIVAMLVKLY